MKKLLKRAFTIVELVIVIAVIAILAAVLIPTFSNIVKKAQISADVQLCRNLNTVLSYAKAEGRIPSSVYDVLYLENEAGYIIENLNPTSEGYYFAWDDKNNMIVYIMDDLETVYYPQTDYELNPKNCWITVGSAEEASVVAAKGYNLALERDIEETINLNNVVSINTLGFSVGDIVINGDGATSNDVAYFTGQFKDITGSIGGASIVQSGTANAVTVSGTTTSSVTIGGYVGSYSATGNVSSTIASTGLVNSVNDSNGSSIVNNGVISEDLPQGQVVAEGSTGKTGSEVSINGNIVAVSDRSGLESIRTQVASGLRNFKDETVQLSSNINMSGIAFSPISSYYRKPSNDITGMGYGAWFSGTFDGNGYSILNLSNNGFAISGLNAGTNKSSESFGPAGNKTKYNEVVYGLFSSVYNATFKNITITCDINMVIDHANKFVGDSVGAICGFATGDYLELENCTVSGTISGYDGVGGLVGRCYAGKLTMTNCTNNADVTSARSAGGLIGYCSIDTAYKTNESAYTFINVVNNGTIRNLGVDYDKNTLQAGVSNTARNGVSYYRASALCCADRTTIKLFTGVDLNQDNVKTESSTSGYVKIVSATNSGVTGFTNNGSVYIAGTQVFYAVLEGDGTLFGN